MINRFRNGEIFMKKLISVFCAIIMLVTSFSFAAFAATKDEANGSVAAINKEFNEFIEKRFDANGSGKLDAADARAILLYSAGMKPETANIGNSDADGDGRVTALDARLVLRLSAQIDSPDLYYSTAQKLDYFNAVINSVKPNRYNYYGMNISSTDAVTYTDPNKVVKTINDRVNAWSGFTGEKMDLGAELTQTETTYTNFSLARVHTISTANFPIYYKDYASILTADNITKIEYKKNQKYNYVHYDRTGKQDYSETVSGLDSITVYIKSDMLTRLPEDTSTLSNGKIFNIIDQKDIDSMLENDFGSMDGIDSIGEFKIDTSFNSIKYYDSFVTIYFDHDTGTAVGVDYNLHYDVSITLKMKVKIDLILLDTEGPITLLSTMTEKDTYYFWNNNEAHIPA